MVEHPSHPRKVDTLILGLYIRRRPHLLDDVLLDTRSSSEDAAFNGTLTTPTPSRQICVVGNSPSQPSLIACIVSGVSRVI